MKVEIPVTPSGFFRASARSLGTTDDAVRAAMIAAGATPTFAAKCQLLRLSGFYQDDELVAVIDAVKRAAVVLRNLEPSGEC